MECGGKRATASTTPPDGCAGGRTAGIGSVAFRLRLSFRNERCGARTPLLNPAMLRPLCLYLAVVCITTAVACAEIPAQPADRFVDSIGVCTHWSYGDTPYGFAFEGAKQRLLQSGIRHIRDSLSDRIVELGNIGIRATINVDADKPIAESLEKIKKANAAGARIDSIEGPNEPDLFWSRFKKSYAGQGYEQGATGIIAGVIAFQKDLYNAVKANAATRSLTVIGPSLGKTYGYDTKSPFGQGTLADAVDWGNFHPYPGGNPFNPPFPYAGVEKYIWHGGQPSTSMDEHPFAFDIYAPPFSPKPMAATETGYSTFNDGPGEAAHAKYLPRLFCEYFRKGIQRTFSYELVDEWNKPDDREANFGLVRFDLSLKPAFFAMQRLIKLVEDPKARPDFEAKPLPVDLEVTAAKGFNRTQYVHHLALQRSDGTYLLLLWHEIALDDTSKKPWHRVPLAPPMPTKLKFAKTVKHAEVFVPNDSDEAIQFFQNIDQMTLGVLDRVMVVRLTF